MMSYLRGEAVLKAQPVPLGQVPSREGETAVKKSYHSIQEPQLLRHINRSLSNSIQIQYLSYFGGHFRRFGVLFVKAL